MAVKTTVSAKRTTAKKKAGASKAKSKATGLQATHAQWKAYQKAYTAAYQNARLNSAARAMRARRLQSANKAIQQYTSARNRAAAASVAAYAAQRSANQAGDASQNSALRARVNANLRTHLTVLARAQYKQASEQSYMQQSIQRTQTAASARSYEEKAFKASTRISRISYKPAASAIAAAVRANAQARSAGSFRSPGAKTSTTAARGRTSIHATSVHQSGKSNRSARTSQRSQSGVAKSAARAHQSSAKSVKAPTKTYAARTAPKPLHPYDLWAPSVISEAPMRPIRMYQYSNVHPLSADYGIPVLNEFTGWYSNEDEPVCILAALANHLLLTTGFHLYQHEMKQLNSAIRYQRRARLLPHGQDILTAVMAAKSWPFSDRLRLKDAWPARMYEDITPGMVIGYEAETGPHAALLIPGHKVISWGEEYPLTAPIEEAWVLQWEVYGGRVHQGGGSGDQG
jgi:hypothetical protein